MESSNIIGYVLSGLGLVGIIASSDKVKTAIPMLNSLPTKYILIGGVMLIAAGLIVLLSSSKSGRVKQVSEEVPIYEGEGKKRKIVGYQRVSK